jgi:hypothetical protein
VEQSLNKAGAICGVKESTFQGLSGNLAWDKAEGRAHQLQDLV